MFIVAAITMGLLLVVLIELTLRVAGVGAETTYQDPLVGFSDVSPLFELDEDSGLYRTARSRRVLFGQQEFAAQKPEDGRRIFCLGGSTVRGRPFTTETAFARWMQLELSARDSSQTYEVLNCGGLSYASYRLTHILDEVLNYDPDVVVIATGHNEFLEDRTYGDIKSRSAIRAWAEDRLHQLRVVRLIQGLSVGSENDLASPEDSRPVLSDLVETRLDEASGYASYHRDDDWSDGVQTHFDQSLRAIVNMCNKADVPVVFVLLGSNIRDCPPFKSEHSPNLKDLDDERRWQTDFTAAEQERDPDQALTLYESAAAIDDEHALLRYRMGRLLDELGRPEEAKEHYLAAKDFDVCPLRMKESFTEIVRLIAEETNSPLVDAREILEEKSPDLISGNDWYMDHVHPSIGAHQWIGEAIVTCLADNELTPGLKPLSGNDRREIYRDHFDRLESTYFIDGYERVSWLENWARRRRLHLDTLPADAPSHLRYGYRLWDFALHDDAQEHFQEAFATDPGLTGRFLKRTRLLFEQGRGPESLLLLESLAETEGVKNIAAEIDQLQQQFEDQGK